MYVRCFDDRYVNTIDDIIMMIILIHKKSQKAFAEWSRILYSGHIALDLEYISNTMVCWARV